MRMRVRSTVMLEAACGPHNQCAHFGDHYSIVLMEQGPALGYVHVMSLPTHFFS